MIAWRRSDTGWQMWASKLLSCNNNVNVSPKVSTACQVFWDSMMLVPADALLELLAVD